MASTRLFVAVELDSRLRAVLGQAIARLEAEEGGSAAVRSAPSAPEPADAESAAVASDVAEAAGVAAVSVLDEGLVAESAPELAAAAEVVTDSLAGSGVVGGRFAVAEAPVARAVQVIDDVVRQGFNQWGHWLTMLPDGPIVDLAEGFLLLLRRSFFNQAPRVTPSPQTASDDGTVSGRIGAFDEEGDPLSYAVAVAPQHGAVQVDQDGHYIYTPGASYSGTDSFAVKISPQRRSLNIVNLAADGSREVTIQIGSANVHDDPDVAVNLTDTAGRISITRGPLGVFRGTVTLTGLTDDTRAMYLDTAGHFGGISVKDLTANYREFKARAAGNGATVDVTLAFSDGDSTQKALILNNVELEVDTAGEYVFTGVLAPNLQIEEDAVDKWDVIGKGYKPMYEAFRETYGIDGTPGWNFRAVEIDFTGGDFYADTITPLSYERVGLYAQDSESQSADGPPSPATTAPTTSSQAAPISEARTPAVAATAGSAVTAAATVGQTTYIGRQDGSVQAWTDGHKVELAKAEAWGTNTGVSTLVAYDRPLFSGDTPLASTFTGYIRGDVLTVTGVGAGSTVLVGSQITGEGVAPGTIITAFLPQTISDKDCDASTNTCTGADGKPPTAKGGVEGLAGTYRVTNNQTIGSDAPSAGPEADTKAPAGIEFTQQTLAGDPIRATSPSLIVGLTNGSIQMYAPTADGGAWTQLHGFEPNWGKVTQIMPYGDGVIVAVKDAGNGNAAWVRQWIGPTTNEPQFNPGDEKSNWEKNWKVLLASGSIVPADLPMGGQVDTSSQSVTAVMRFKDRPDICRGSGNKGACDGFLVGLSDGRVLKYNEGQGGVGKPGWEQPGKLTSSVVGIVEYGKLIQGGNDYLPSFAVGTKDGAVNWWAWDGSKYRFIELQRPGGWATEMTAMAQLGEGVGSGFVVGLKNSSVQWVQPRMGNTNLFPSTITELHDDGWKHPVTTIRPITTGGKQGVIVGLGNGSVQLWNGGTGPTGKGTTGQNFWTELHDSGWASGVAAIAPVAGSKIDANDKAVRQDGVIVALANGSVQQWTGKISGRTAQNDWVELEAGGPPSAQRVLGNAPADLTCDSNWVCTQPGTLRDGVTFAKQYAGNAGESFGASEFATRTKGVGSAKDPIFSQLRPNTNSGKVYPIAFNYEFSPEFLNYFVGDRNSADYKQIGIKGTIKNVTNPSCGDGKESCTVLLVQDVTTPGKTFRDITSGMELDPGWRYNALGLSKTEIGKYGGTSTEFGFGIGNGDVFLLKKDLPKTAPSFDVDMTVRLPAPAKIGIDINPVGYGYVVVPDGFYAKFSPGSWSLAALVAAEIGPSVRLDAKTTKIELLKKDFKGPSYSTVSPYGVIDLSSGVKLGAEAKLNVPPSQKNYSGVDVHAYAVPGVLMTYNTTAAPKQFDLGYSYYLEADASAIRNLGATVSASATPYVKLTYGILIPSSVPLVGGWALVAASASLENPLTASLCAGLNQSCPKGTGKDEKTGATASLTLGTSGTLNLQAGLLPDITSLLTYKVEPIELYPEQKKVIVLLDDVGL